MKLSFTILTVFLLGLLPVYLTAQEEMDSCIESHGNPEDINKYDSEGYHSWTFWYWCQGFSRTFTLGKNVYGCETSTYTFSPICALQDIDRPISKVSFCKEVQDGK